MSDSDVRLPARPSLEHLRKQAKERLKSLRASTPGATLADAQYALAQSYGFDSWPRLVHHIESVRSSGRLDQFEQLAADVLAGYHGDEDALRRLIAHFGVSYSPEQLQVRIRSHVDDARNGTGEPSLTDTRMMLARQYGFEDWDGLARGLAQPPDSAIDARLGLSSAPPFYRIDWTNSTIEPRPPLTDADWDAVFEVMREHGLTGISGAALTDRAAPRLADLEFVTRVNVGGARSLTDDGLLQLARMPQLEELDLSGWHSPLTDRGLEVFRHLPRLRRVQMCWPQRITDAGIAHLAHCEHLETVDLLGTNTGDAVIAALRGKRHLTKLKTGRLLTDRALPLLHEIPHFKTWHDGTPEFSLMSPDAAPTHLLLDGPITREGIAGLAGLDGLFGLTFFWHLSALKGADLGPLADLSNLGFLGCQDALCDDDAMRHIGALPNLKMLMGQGAVATDLGFAALSRSSTLECIWGRECPNFGDRGFMALASMPRLRGIAISCKNVSEHALESLPRFPALRGIMPMDVSDAGFRYVGQCLQLENLWCMYCRDTGDIATSHIAKLPRLATYYAGKTRITDRSLETLAAMSTLRKLEFWEVAAITDAGVAALARLPNLHEISIWGSPRVTRKAMAVFAPSVRVELGS